jgi:hypothetical protein
VDKRLAILFLVGFCSSTVFGQFPLPVLSGGSCSYAGAPVVDDMWGFPPSQEAEQMIDSIVAKVGLKPNFKLFAATVPTARADLDTTGRYILYSEDFIQHLRTRMGTNWGGIAVLAHEVGHHLNGHTFGTKNNSNRKQEELEADEFSGFVLARMGASLDQAQESIRALKDETSVTHPNSRYRLEAVAVGWKRGSVNRAVERTIPGEKLERVPEKLPATSTKDCQTKATGSYCFANRSTKTIVSRVTFVYQYGRNAESLTIRPGQKECFYDKPVGSYSYTLTEIMFERNPVYPVNNTRSVGQGTLRFEQCGTSTYSYP